MKRKDRKKKRKRITREQKKRVREWKIKRVRDAMFREPRDTFQKGTMPLSYLQVNFPKHHPAIVLHDTIIDIMKKEMAKMAIIKCD